MKKPPCGGRSEGGGLEAVTGSDPLPHVREERELFLGEAREERRAKSRAMRDARFLQARSAGVGETGVGAARVVAARAALEQPVAREPVDEPRQAAARRAAPARRDRTCACARRSPPRGDAAPRTRSSAGGAGGRARRRYAWRGRRARAAGRAKPSAPRASAPLGRWASFRLLSRLPSDLRILSPAKPNIAASRPATGQRCQPLARRCTEAQTRRVARQAQTIISGCSGRRAYSAQRGNAGEALRLARHVEVRREDRRQKRDQVDARRPAQRRHQNRDAADELGDAAGLHDELLLAGERAAGRSLRRRAG